METNLRISGFKCFADQNFILKNITLLTGSNGTGKSSLIQALLLARLSIEKNLRHHNEQDYLLSEEWNDILIPLNNGYQLKLGNIYDIIRDKDSKENLIIIGLDNETYKFGIPDNYEENTSVKVSFEQSSKSETIPFWRKKEFYYLHTERLGPRHSLEVNFTDFIHCGYQGEYTAQVLVNIAQKVGFTSAMLNDKTMKLEQFVNYWLDSVCPGITISAVPISTMSAQIKVRGNSNKSEMLATNIGFGVSYVLPILVNGLIAKKDSLFIVENPEAHLHPKGQSNIGYFLGKVAEAGVKVVVETHSEHVVNGLRRALLSSSILETSDANIYFFNGFDENEKMDVKTINIESNGNLTDFPIDFFDQTRQDLLEILKLSGR